MTVLHTPIGQFDMVEWPGRNTSGIQPFGDSILILPDQASVSINGVYVPPDTIERTAEAAETGVLVAVGEGAWAWTSDRSRRYEGRKPEPGTRVYFERYAGGKFHGVDGCIYRLMTDKCVAGFAVEPEGEPVALAGREAHAAEAIKLQNAITNRGLTPGQE